VKAEDIRRAHADYFKSLAEEAEPHLIGEHQKEWLDRLDTEHDNLRAALGWSVEKAPELGSHVAIALIRFWDIRGHITEGRKWLDRILDRMKQESRERMRLLQGAALLADAQDYQSSIAYAQEALSLGRKFQDDRAVARALIDLSSAQLRLGELEPAASSIEDAVARARSIADDHLLVRALNNLANVRFEQERQDEAISLYKEGARIAESSSDKRGVMMALLNLGWTAAFAREFEDARDYLGRTLKLAQELADPSFEAGAWINLGIVDLLMNEPQKAIPRFQRALNKAIDTGSTYVVVDCLDGLAAAVGGKDTLKAFHLFAASEAIRARSDLPRSSAEQSLYQPRIDVLKDQLTREQQAEVLREGLTLEDAILAAQAAGEGLE
jgi:tetratricopeptide (TPR) repeat protein